MDIQVYTISNCGYCGKVKQLLERAKLDYIQTVVGRDITREEFKELYPRITGFPYVLIDGESIGGLIDTVKYLVDKGLVTAKRKS